MLDRHVNKKIKTTCACGTTAVTPHIKALYCLKAYEVTVCSY